MSSILLSWRRPTLGSWVTWTWCPSCQTISTFTSPLLCSRSPSLRISPLGLAFSQVSEFPLIPLNLFIACDLILTFSFPVFGFQQFLDQDSELTQELVEEGKEHIKRERRRIQRMLESASRRRDYAARFLLEFGLYCKVHQY